MHAVLTFQITVGILATLDLHGDTLDAGVIALEQVRHRHLMTVSLSPAHIHTHQHLCPVLSLRTTGATINLQHGIHRILFLTKHVHQFQILNGLHGFGVVVVNFLLCHHLLLKEVEGQLQFVCHGAHLVIAIKPLLDALHLLHLLLSTLTIFPEVGRLRAEVFLLVFYLLLIDFEIPIQRIGSLHHIFQLILCNHNS